MPTPRILLLSRSAVESKHPELQAFLSSVPVNMAIAQSDGDAEAAKTLTNQVATLTSVTAIVADFAGCLVVNDDGSVEAIVLPEIAPVEDTPLIQLI